MRKSKTEIPRRAPGSLTVEASWTAPLLLAFLTLGMVLLQTLSLEWTLHQTAEQVVRAAARRGETNLSAEVMALDFDAALLAGGESLSLIRYGMLGLDFSESQITDRTITLSVRCRVQVPFALLGPLQLPASVSVSARRWVGFVPSQESSGSETVYITPYGEAWHRDAACVYLRPSVREIAASSVLSARSRDGRRYTPCPLCHPSGEAVVFITGYGTVYHGRADCSGLKRTLQVVTRREAEVRGYHACPRCGSGAAIPEE